MVTINLRIICVYFVAVGIVMCSADPVGKHWPDLSCHEFLENDMRHSGTKEHKATWEGCQIRNNQTGQCAKTCVLREYRILYNRRSWKSDPSKSAVCYSNGEVSKYITVELGLIFPPNMVEDSPEKEEIRIKMQKISTPIMERGVECKKKFGLQFMERNIRGPCSEWTDLLDCLDKSFGCASKEFKHD